METSPLCGVKRLGKPTATAGALHGAGGAGAGAQRGEHGGKAGTVLCGALQLPAPSPIAFQFGKTHGKLLNAGL